MFLRPLLLLLCFLHAHSDNLDLIPSALDDSRAKLDFTHKNCTKINYLYNYQSDSRDTTSDSNHVIPCEYIGTFNWISRNLFPAFKLFPVIWCLLLCVHKCMFVTQAGGSWENLAESLKLLTIKVTTRVWESLRVPQAHLRLEMCHHEEDILGGKFLMLFVFFVFSPIP